MSAAVPTVSPVVAVLKKYLQAVVCVVFSIVLIVLIYFRLQALPALEEKEAAGAKRLDVILRNQAQGADLQEELKELKRLTAGMNERLLVVDDKATNLQFFYDIETKSKASIIDLSQGASDAGDGVLRPKLSEFTGLSFYLTMSGRIGYVMNFLKRMESGKFFVRCSSATLKGNQTLAPDAVDVVLKLEVLAKKPQ